MKSFYSKKNLVKFPLPLLLAGTLILSACDSTESKCEKAIALHEETDSHGTWTDLKFKVLSMDISDFTVADSINVLKKEFEKGKEGYMSRLNLALDISNKLRENNLKSRFFSKSEDEKSIQEIHKIETKIDSLLHAKPDNISQYEGRDTTDVVALIVKCHYRYVMPGSTSDRERSDTYLLKPDGSEVLDKNPSELFIE